VYLTRHQTPTGPCWAVDNKLLPPALTLSALLSMSSRAMSAFLTMVEAHQPATGLLLSPLDPQQEVWAAGVTYLRSRDARQAESKAGDVYQRVYDADRPEVFFKAAGWRVQGHGMPVHVRSDSHWNVPEPEMVVVINALGEIAGYCAGNDMSSRDIEGENPLYLPQAKVYDRSCALGPGIILARPELLRDLPIQVIIARNGVIAFQGRSSTGQMKRNLEDLAAYLTREMAFPHGVFLMTGTCVVPPDDFSLQPGDVVTVKVGGLAIENPVD
jgi:2-dehydro-3-deoxy-D-arabinonate dehydratase